MLEYWLGFELELRLVSWLERVSKVLGLGFDLGWGCDVMFRVKKKPSNQTVENGRCPESTPECMGHREIDSAPYCYLILWLCPTYDFHEDRASVTVTELCSKLLSSTIGRYEIMRGPRQGQGPRGAQPRTSQSINAGR